MEDTQDSNGTGLRFAIEETPKVLPSSGVVWYPLEPNSYPDFGGQVSTKARRPINPGRQRRKGKSTGIESSAGIVQDFTLQNSVRIMQAAMFALVREKPTTAPLNGVFKVITNVDGVDDQYEATGLGTFKSGAVVQAVGFAVAANNGVKVLDAVSGTALDSTSDLVAEVPPATAYVETVGYQFVSGDATLTIVSGLQRLNSAAVDLTTRGFIPGEWIYLGDDVSGNRFATADVGGFARISVIAAGYLEFDKTDWEPATDTGVGKTIRIYTGTVLRNEPLRADIVKQYLALERTLGEDDDGQISEVVQGCVASEMTFNMPEEDIVTIEIKMMGLDVENRTGATGLSSGTRPDLPANVDAFNTSIDFSRLKLGVVSTTDSNITPLIGYFRDANLTVQNNNSRNTALGQFGGISMTAGMFEVGGSVTGYFSDMRAVQAVRDNSDVTLDGALVRDNEGVLFDIPLVGLGGGRLDVQQDQSIMLPLEQLAGESSFGHTLLFMFFPYLPAVAEG